MHILYVLFPPTSVFRLVEKKSRRHPNSCDLKRLEKKKLNMVFYSLILGIELTSNSKNGRNRHFYIYFDSSHRFKRTLISYIYPQRIKQVVHKTKLGHTQNINGVNSARSEIMKNVWKFTPKISILE